ncbi:hypothetical protein [Streptomyces sp. NPDC048606]|uniref:hypothetical protein n=1 Tax=Streptomyces sp. NPDC048606 TaxID=3154726 RepID=UPI003431B7D7
MLATLGAGCGRGGGPPRGGPEDTLPRRERVAAAWQDPQVLRQWRSGFHPLGAQDWQPAGGFRSGADKAAHAAGNFTLRAELPAAPPPAVPVRFPDGGEVAVGLLTAGEAYAELDRAPDGDPTLSALTVTAVRFATTPARTGRGPAEVPAWLFTVEGYDTPLPRFAVRPEALPKPPIEPLAPFEGGAAPLWGYVAVPPGATSFEVTAGHGACDDGVAVDVLEGADTVVLAGRILPSKDPRGARGAHGESGCDMSLRRAKVLVTLSRPPGERILLDSLSGAPLEAAAR